MTKWTEENAHKQRSTRTIGGLFRPIFGLMAEIGHNFLRPFKNYAIYFRPYFFRPSDFRSTVIQLTANYGRLIDFISVFWVFSYNIDDFSCLNYFISAKLSLIVSNQYTHFDKSNFWYLVYFYSKPMHNIFLFSKKRPRLKWTTYKYFSDKSKKCLPIGYSGVLSVSASVSLLLFIPAYVKAGNIYQKLGL